MKKRLFALFLALVMALGLTATAWADEPTDLNLDGKTTQAESVLYSTNPSSSVDVTGYVLTGGSYKLTGDLTIAAPLIVTGTVTLDLNGHVLKYENSTAKNSVIVVKNGENFTLKDSGSGGKITGGTGTNWSVNLTGGITRSYNCGGGVFVGSQATFKMEGGSIVDCSVSEGQYVRGGGVYLSNGTSDRKTTFNMTGGSIVHCSAAEAGGGVCVGAEASFTMSNGRIDDCTAKNYGGGVFGLGAFTMTGGIIEACNASDNSEALLVCAGMVAQGGCVRGGVVIDCDNLKNDSSDGSTIFYGDVKKTTTSGQMDFYKEFTDNLVTFKTGETTYARTFFKAGGGKISQPDAPTAEEGKVFAGWYTAETGGSQWNFDTATVSDNMTLYARWHDLTEVPAKAATCTETGNTQHWKCETCNKLFTDSAGTTETTASAVTTEKNPNNHAAAGVWHSDSKNHWMAYDDCCKFETEKTAHSFDGRTCTVCGYEQPAHSHTRRQNTTPAATDTTTDADEAKTDVVTSAKTFDTGVAVYGAMAIASLLGMGYVGKKRV